MALLSILFESKRVLTESDLFSLSKDKRILFHYTDFRNASEILLTNVLKVGFHNMGWERANANKAHKYGTQGISLTRNPHSIYWGDNNLGRNGACLILDAQKLKTKYPIFPVSAKDDNKRGRTYSIPSDFGESEPFTPQPYMEEVVPRNIKNISNYVLGVGIEIQDPTFGLDRHLKNLVNVAESRDIQLYKMITDFGAARMPKSRKFYKQDDPTHFFDVLEKINSGKS